MFSSTTSGFFDLQTRKTSQVEKGGDWHLGDYWVFLAAKSDVIYLVGGWSTSFVNSIPFTSFSDLIRDAAIKAAFKNALLPAEDRIAVLQKELIASCQELRLAQSELRRTQLLLCQEQSTRSSLSSQLSATNVRVYQATNQLSEQAALLSTLHTKIEEAEKRERSLQEELERRYLPPGRIVIRLPFRELPPIAFPQKWAIDIQRLQKFVGAKDEHLKTIPRKQALLAEYRRAFGPLLDERIPRRILSVSEFAPSRMARDSSVAQVSASLRPTELFPKDAGIAAQTKRYSLRPEDKLLDSAAAQHTIFVYENAESVSKNVMPLAPPEYRSFLSSINSHDPLEAESNHCTLSRLRRLVQASAVLSSAEKTSGLDKPILLLQKAKGLRDSGYRGTLEKTPPAAWVAADSTPQDEQAD